MGYIGKIARAGIMGLFVIIGAGCGSPNAERPPYAISKPVSAVGAKENCYAFAGIEFELYNASDLEITAIEVSCVAYDAETKKNPLAGSNSLRFNSDISIPPHASRPLALSLDPWVYSAPKTPWLIDFFYVPSITYSDGSSWRDSTGAYYTRSF